MWNVTTIKRASIVVQPLLLICVQWNVKKLALKLSLNCCLVNVRVKAWNNSQAALLWEFCTVIEFSKRLLVLWVASHESNNEPWMIFLTYFVVPKVKSSSKSVMMGDMQWSFVIPLIWRVTINLHQTRLTHLSKPLKKTTTWHARKN